MAKTEMERDKNLSGDEPKAATPAPRFYQVIDEKDYDVSKGDKILSENFVDALGMYSRRTYLRPFSGAVEAINNVGALAKAHGDLRELKPPPQTIAEIVEKLKWRMAEVDGDHWQLLCGSQVVLTSPIKELAEAIMDRHNVALTRACEQARALAILDLENKLIQDLEQSNQATENLHKILGKKRIEIQELKRDIAAQIEKNRRLQAMLDGAYL